MSDSVRPHRRQSTWLPRPWDSPGTNTGVGCHFPLQCMKVKSESEVAESCPTLSDPMDYSPPGSSVHGIFQVQEYWSGVPLPSLEAIRVGPNSIWLMSSYEEAIRTWEDHAKTRRWQHLPANRRLQKKVTLPTPWSLISTLQNLRTEISVV